MTAYRRCPNCGAEVFFVEKPGGGLVFFRVDERGRAVLVHQTGAEPPDLTGREIFCAGCGWHGRVDELEE